MEEEIVVLPIDDDDYEEESPVKKSKRGRPKKKKQVWTTEHIANLIELWKEEPSLYIDTQKFKNKDNRTEAIERLRIKMIEVSDLNVTVEEIEKKLQSLKSYYIVTSKKVELSKQNPDDVAYQPSWAHFESLDFLKDNITSKALLDGTLDNSIHHTEESPLPKRRRRSKPWLREKDVHEVEEPEEEIPNHPMTNSNNLSTDHYFCQMLLSQLKNFENRPRKEYLKLQIQQLVYETMFGDPQPNQSSSTDNVSMATDLNGEMNGH